MSASTLRQVTALETLSMEGLRERWRELFGGEPPGYGRSLLIRRLAYRIQELAYGGLTEETKAKLEEAMQELNTRGGPSKPRPQRNGKPVAGTRIVREWQGARYEVTVVDRGFEFGGRRYRSLSAIARVITGTRWNGPAFFGLREANGKGSS